MEPIKKSKQPTVVADIKTLRHMGRGLSPIARDAVAYLVDMRDLELLQVDRKDAYEIDVQKPKQFVDSLSRLVWHPVEGRFSDLRDKGTDHPKPPAPPFNLNHSFLIWDFRGFQKGVPYFQLCEDQRKELQQLLPFIELLAKGIQAELIAEAKIRSEPESLDEAVVIPVRFVDDH